MNHFDLEMLTQDRDQLWAEAATVEAAGESIRLGPALWQKANLEQEGRRVEDPYFDTLAAVLGDEIEGKLRSEDAWTIIGKPAGNRTQEDNDRLGEAMRRLGFQRDRLRFGGKGPEHCYVRGAKTHPIVLDRDGHDRLVGAQVKVGDTGSLPF